MTRTSTPIRTSSRQDHRARPGRHLLRGRLCCAASIWLASAVLPAQEPQSGSQSSSIDAADVAAAAKVAGLEWTDAEVQQAVRRVRSNIAGYLRMRGFSLRNGAAPAWTAPRGVPDRWRAPDPSGVELPEATRPGDLAELHFAPVAVLASLVRSQQVSCLELTELFLARLAQVDATLHCVVNLLPERARARARELDEMLAEGIWLGPLHGIPFGAKDLLTAKGAATTWGAAPFQEQRIEADAEVIRALESRGAVLVGKLTLGALAMGDVWFGGRTRTPWNPERGSSGSSAGPASATAAGALPFAIGSETYGSILSPSRQCGNTALRPTHGLVPMDGAMVLSWSMDKLGPMGRSADDIAWMFAGMAPERGVEGRGYRFEWPCRLPLESLVVGYVAGDFEPGQVTQQNPSGLPEVVSELQQLGCTVREIPWEIEAPVADAVVLLSCEAAAAFDEFTRSGRDDELTRQGAGAWPNLLRVARLVPAVEYLQAQRVRRILRQEVDQAMAGIDVLVHPSHSRLGLFNLTGHPSGVSPRGPGRPARRSRRSGAEDAAAEGGADQLRAPTAIGFTGQRFGEAAILSIMKSWQKATGHGSARPPAFR